MNVHDDSDGCMLCGAPVAGRRVCAECELPSMFTPTEASKLTCNTQTLCEGVNEYYFVKDKIGTPLRLGQYIWNKYGRKDTSWPELFYEESEKGALEKAYNEAFINEVLGY